MHQASSSPYQTTAGDLVGALGRIGKQLGVKPRVPDAIDRAIEGMQARVTESRDAVVSANTRICLAEPFRIPVAIFGAGEPMVWPVEGYAVSDLLWLACAKLDSEIARGRAGHWTYDANRQIALEGAVGALVVMMEAA